MNRFFFPLAFFLAPSALFVFAACGVDELEHPQHAAAAAAVPANVVAAADPPGFLVGQICDKEANTGVFAIVTAVRDDDGLERAAHTDDDGNFRLALPPGGYVASADTADFMHAWGFDIAPGVETHVEGCAVVDNALPRPALVDGRF